VQRASFDEARAKWVLETSAGAHEADLLVTACGQLSVPSVPSLPGLDGFEGPAFHSARWRHDVPIAGKRVAVVGSGCSAIQIVPAIQPITAHVDVYQRSPGWTVPRLDGPYSERAQRMFERFPLVQRLDRQATFGVMELGALALTSRPRLRAPLRAVGRWQITKAITDPELRQKVMPADEIGCKRMMLTDEWYPTLTRANVSLVNDPIREVTRSGIRTDDGTERPADVLVLATAIAHPRAPLRGSSSQSVSDGARSAIPVRAPRRSELSRPCRGLLIEPRPALVSPADEPPLLLAPFSA
jgi:cation diffusion facilitator CzcD-associated flavoprotein CzcO